MADYTKTEPAFDFQKGDFIIINGRPKMTVGRERIKNWVQKILNTQKITIVTTSVRKSSER